MTYKYEIWLDGNMVAFDEGYETINEALEFAQENIMGKIEYYNENGVENVTPSDFTVVIDEEDEIVEVEE